MIDEILPYRNSRMDEARRKLRNRIRKFDPSQVIWQSIRRLSRLDLNDKSGYPRNLVLFLIEMTFRDWLEWPARGNDLTEKGLNGLLNQVSALESHARMPSDYANLPRFFKTLSYQQFYLQDELHINRIARPLVLYDLVNAEGYLAKRFMEMASLPVTRFQEFAAIYTLLTWDSTGHPPSATADQLARSLKCDFAEMERFLGLISLRFDEVGRFLTEHSRVYRSGDYDFRKETTLTLRPVVREDNVYIPYSRSLLTHALEHFVYDTLRDDSAQNFMNEFAVLFEKYVGLGLRQTGLNVIAEDELRRFLPSDSKVVDYMVIEDSGTVLIEAKGVQMHALARVSENADVIGDKLSDSLIKAILQGNEVATNLNANPPKELSAAKDAPWFLLVITYKPMFVGNGHGLAGVLDETLMADLNAKLGKQPRMPLKHVYFLSVDEYDYLLGVLQAGASLVQMLKDVVAKDSDPATATWAFCQHLTSRQAPRHLVSRYEELCAAVSVGLQSRGSRPQVRAGVL